MRKLPQKYKKIYEEFYLSYSNANTFFRKISLIVEKWYHLKAFKSFPYAKSILEIGAGNLNHIEYEKNFEIYDIVEPKRFLLNAAKNIAKNKVRSQYSSINNVPKKNLYEKILAIAVLEHIENLNSFLFEVKKHLKPNGKLIIEIPAEGEFLWWLGWRLTTGIGFWLKYRLDYGVIIRYEHINSAEKVISSIKEYFVIENISSFPLNFKNMRLYIHIVCKNK